MFYSLIGLLALGGFLFLGALSVGRAGDRVYLATLDLVSYMLTSVTLVTLLVATQGQVSQAFSNLTGQDLPLGVALKELHLFLETKCGEEPECAEVGWAISSTFTIRGPGKSPYRVNSDVSRLPELEAAVKRYNEAFDQYSARNRILLQNAGFWISLIATYGVIIGLLRRILVLKDAIQTQRP